jgi:hypothetical protein
MISANADASRKRSWGVQAGAFAADVMAKFSLFA